jgi:hypothetical protein
LDHAPDLACCLVAAACQQLQRQVDRAAYQAEPANPSPHTSAWKTRPAPIFDLSVIGHV